MTSGWYVAAAIATASGVTFALRAASFLARALWRDSGLVARVARALPLGVLTVLALWVITRLRSGSVTGGVAESVALAVTVLVHRWRHHLGWSLVAGTGVCVALSNVPALLH